MKIVFNLEDTKRILLDSFCNGGLSELKFCSISVDWTSDFNHTNYVKAKSLLIEMGEENICYEDVMLQILINGDEIEFTDFENGETIRLNLQTAHDNFNNLSEDEKIILINVLNEDFDAYDCFSALQYALYQDVIYG